MLYILLLSSPLDTATTAAAAAAARRTCRSECCLYPPLNVIRLLWRLGDRRIVDDDVVPHNVWSNIVRMPEMPKTLATDGRTRESESSAAREQALERRRRGFTETQIRLLFQFDPPHSLID
jgi:hypothetical protein